jgi:hypothetical protein
MDCTDVSFGNRNYSAHSVHGHSPALDSGFRRNDGDKVAFSISLFMASFLDSSFHRNDESKYIFSTLVMPAKAGIQIFPLTLLSSYQKSRSLLGDLRAFSEAGGSFSNGGLDNERN